ncbi:MAG: ROK family protein [Verrucomicrobia bacterium]|nr:ROK family protein [Verrucomicrobiota bacterium]
MESPRYVGIEIGGTKLQLVAGTARGEIIERQRFAVDSRAGAEGIQAQIVGALPSLAQQHRAIAIGAGFGGPVDIARKSIACSHQVEGWSGFALGAWLEALAGIPAIIENDANTATLGEALAGAGRGSNPVFYTTLGSGVGGGLVVDGQIYHGSRPGEAEIGHLRLDRSGAIVESRCSGWAVDRKIRAAIERTPDCLLGRLTQGRSGGEAAFLGEALHQNDPLANSILQETAADLAFALSHVTHLFHPETIVLGGGLSLLGEPLRAAVAKNLEPWVMEVFRPAPVIRIAGLGEDSVPVGALLLAAHGAATGCRPERGVDLNIPHQLLPLPAKNERGEG